MSSAIKAFVFDWAGTMIDFGCMAPVRALQAAFADLKLELTEAEARADMGMAKRAHITAILGRQPMRDRFVAVWGRPSDASDIDALFDAVEPKMVEAAADCAVLIDGAADLAKSLRASGVRIGSGTGYSRSMMDAILKEAEAEGYSPEVVVCAGETTEGRPSPLMSWKALVELGAWPSRACVKVDDAEVGITEGREAGMWTIGLAASGNGVGLTRADFDALSDDERRERVAKSAEGLKAAGADYVVDSVADIAALLLEIEARIAAGERPGEHHQN